MHNLLAQGELLHLLCQCVFLLGEIFDEIVPTDVLVYLKCQNFYWVLLYGVKTQGISDINMKCTEFHYCPWVAVGPLNKCLIYI